MRSAHYGDREMSRTDGISTFIVGSKSCLWIWSTKRPCSGPVPEKSTNGPLNGIITLLSLLHYVKRLYVWLMVPSKHITSR